MTIENTLLNTEETYRSLQPFQSVAELNENTKAVRELYADQMTPATYDVLDVLHRWSCKFPGVCYRSKGKIAEELNISRKTVTRACNTLVDLGVIVQHETKRKGGDKRRSTNAIVFVRVMSAVPTDVLTECPSIDTPTNTLENTNTFNTNDTEALVIHRDKIAVKKNEEQEEQNEVAEFNPNDKANLKASLPDGWYEESSAYATDYNDLYAITGELFKAKKGTDLRVEEHVSEFGEVLRKSWVSFKNGRIEQSKWYAYLFTAFKRTAIAIERRERMAPIMQGIAERMGFDTYEANGRFS